MRTVPLWVFCLMMMACGHTQPDILAATPSAGQSEPRKFNEPGSELAFAVKKTSWAPATIGPASAATLAQALNDKQSLMILLGKQFQGPSDEDRVFQMVKAAAPETKIVARNSAILDEILLERGEIPYRQTWEVGGQDVFGRPWLLPKDHPLQTDWLQKKTELKGAEAILLMDYVTPDERKLREMRAQTRGGCDELHAEITRSISISESWFSVFVDQVNDALASEFTRQMKTALPFWKNELAQSRSQVAPGTHDARCFAAYDKFLSRYDDCLSDNCSLSPMLHAEAGGVIGMELSGAVVIPHDCPVGVGRNYVDELMEIGRRISREIMAEIPQRWAGEFSKLGMLTKLEERLTDLCAPAHRRYAPADLATAQEKVNAFLEHVVSGSFQGSWESAEGKARVPGVGSVLLFGRAKSKGGEWAVWDAQLSDIFKPLNRCRDSQRRAVQVGLVDVATSEVYFSAIVFEEQLFCEGLPPN